jgi:hypothetical protein
VGAWHPSLARHPAIGPVIRGLDQETDPMFRQAGMSLD